MQSAISDDVMTFYLKGRIDTSNSAEVEKEIFDVAEKEKLRKIKELETIKNLSQNQK